MFFCRQFQIQNPTTQRYRTGFDTARLWSLCRKTKWTSHNVSFFHSNLNFNLNFNGFFRFLSPPYSDGETLTHLLKASLGTGILSMPIAFMYSGIIMGIIATIITALICTHCSYVLVSGFCFGGIYNGKISDMSVIIQQVRKLSRLIYTLKKKRN